MIWLDGQIYPTSRVPFDVRDRGLTLGDGLFETIGVFGGQPFALAAHLDRLAAGLGQLGMGCDRDLIMEGIAALLAAAGLALAALRVTVTRGTGTRGLAPPTVAHPSLLITLAPWGVEQIGQPLKLATAAICRNPTSPLSRLKTLAYLDNVLAAQAAVQAGADDALMLNTEGRVACTAMANLFVIAGRQLITPPVVDGVLPGIMRGLVLQRAQEAGYTAVEASLTPAALRGADGVFATNSLRLVMPVTCLDGRALSVAPVAPLVTWIGSMVEAACGAVLISPDREEQGL